MSKEVLGIDFDEVVRPLVDPFLEEYQPTNGTVLTRDHFTTYRWEDVLGLSVEETLKIVHAFHRAGELHIDLLEHAHEGLERLKTRFELDMITARDSIFEAELRQYINVKSPEIFRDIHMIGYDRATEKPRTKAEICLEIGAIGMLDDNLGHLIPCVDVGVEGILIGNHPWNQAEALPEGIVRKSHLVEVAEYFGV